MSMILFTCTMRRHPVRRASAPVTSSRLTKFGWLPFAVCNACLQLTFLSDAGLMYFQCYFPKPKLAVELTHEVCHVGLRVKIEFMFRVKNRCITAITVCELPGNRATQQSRELCILFSVTLLATRSVTYCYCHESARIV